MFEHEKNPWKKISGRTVFESPWLGFEEHQVIKPDGKEGVYGVVISPRAAGCVPIDEYGYTWLVGQYRYPTDTFSWEIPMGALNEGEDAEDGAKRELREETGLVANKLTPLGTLHASNSNSNEELKFFLAEDLQETPPSFDETEAITIKKLLFQDAVDMAMDGRITDAPSIAMLLKLAVMDVVKSKLRVLFQDEYCVIVHKPSGILVHRTEETQDRDFLVQRLRNQIDKKVWPIHRLDRPTSGVIMFGFSPEISSKFFELFSKREINKSYLALVRGHTDDAGTIDYPLKAKDSQETKEAVTHYETLGRVEIPVAVGPYETARYSLVRVRIETGRTHQIRRHFAHIRHPVIGDSKYGDNQHNRMFKQRLQSARLLLMSESLRFTHPFTNAEVDVRTELDSEFADVLNHIGINYKNPE